MELGRTLRGCSAPFPAPWEEAAHLNQCRWAIKRPTLMVWGTVWHFWVVSALLAPPAL